MIEMVLPVSAASALLPIDSFDLDLCVDGLASNSWPHLIEKFLSYHQEIVRQTPLRVLFVCVCARFGRFGFGQFLALQYHRLVQRQAE
jgi:hypothetical protein